MILYCQECGESVDLDDESSWNELDLDEPRCPNCGSVDLDVSID